MDLLGDCDPTEQLPKMNSSGIWEAYKFIVPLELTGQA